MGASREFERSPIQQVFGVGSSKSHLDDIPDNNHYLEYDEAQTKLGFHVAVL
ncbi:hypothetical protein JOY44_28160 (plasmid) [Phormidium sp. CLA17]|nr:hypothetical protein [Leptolyngbya sp. Cla-17]